MWIVVRHEMPPRRASSAGNPAVSPSMSEPLERPGMSKRLRVVIVVIVIELLLAGGWIWLHNMALTSSHATADSTRVIGQMFGGAMGVVLALSPLLYLLARRNDLKSK
jgi:hypothetical protein